VLFSSGILAQAFGGDKVTAGELSRAIVSAVAKDGADDLAVVREYCETVAKGRGGAWKELHGKVRAMVKG
jgi:hypothetical protein